MEKFFVISPKLQHRAVLMPRLVETISKMRELEIVGQGAASIKVRAVNVKEMTEEFPEVILKRFPQDLRDGCFFERAHRYRLAAK